MHKILYFIVVFLLISSCNNTLKNQHSIENLVPNNAAIVLSINSLEGFKSALNNTDLASKTALFTPLQKALKPLDSIQSMSPLLVCVSNELQENVYTFITHRRNLKTKDSLLIPFIIIDSILIASESEATLETIKAQKRSDYSKIHKLHQLTNTFSLYHKELPSLQSMPDVSLGAVFLEFNMTPESVTINGHLLDAKSENKWFRLFEKLDPQSQGLQAVFPSESHNISIFNYTDFEQLQRNIDSLETSSKASELAKAFFNTTEEIGVFETEQGDGVALKSIDISATYEALSGFQNELSSFRSIPLFEFTESSLFNDTFGPLISKVSPTKFITLEDYLVFSDSEEVLKLVISNYFNKNTLESSIEYETLQKSLSDEASIQTYFNNYRLAELLNTLFQSTLKGSELSDYKLSGIQLVKDDNIVHLNLSLIHI